jgi:hypothetical protein
MLLLLLLLLLLWAAVHFPFHRQNAVFRRRSVSREEMWRESNEKSGR